MTYFITFRCYGTWLHGDARGSVDFAHNHYNEPLIERNIAMENQRRRALKSDAVALGAKQRHCVEVTIRNVALHREWKILALCALSNHVHIVVGTDENTKPEKVLIDFKAWSTRNLREQKLMPPKAPIWAEHGSTKYLWNEKSITAACNYVEEQSPNSEHEA